MHNLGIIVQRFAKTVYIFTVFIEYILTKVHNDQAAYDRETHGSYGRYNVTIHAIPLYLRILKRRPGFYVVPTTRPRFRRLDMDSPGLRQIYVILLLMSIICPLLGQLKVKQRQNKTAPGARRSPGTVYKGRNAVYEVKLLIT